MAAMGQVVQIEEAIFFDNEEQYGKAIAENCSQQIVFVKVDGILVANWMWTYVDGTGSTDNPAQFETDYVGKYGLERNPLYLKLKTKFAEDKTLTYYNPQARFDITAGIKQKDFDRLLAWQDGFKGVNNRAAIFDWDRTLTVIEYMWLLSDDITRPVKIDHVYNTKDSWTVMDVFPLSPEGITLEDYVMFLCGGAARVQLLRSMFKYCTDNSIAIYILTNNLNCTGPQNAFPANIAKPANQLFTDLAHTLVFGGHSIRSPGLIIICGSDYNFNKAAALKNSPGFAALCAPTKNTSVFNETTKNTSVFNETTLAPKVGSSETLIDSKPLKNWILSKQLEFKVVAQKRDANNYQTDQALAIVRSFIIKKKLIVYGGLAIDYALRLKGSSIYPEDERPDFDFFSTQNVDDAYELADILAKAGFDDVRARRAIHIQTMRVGIFSGWVADIGYVPPEIFSRIPVLEYQHIRIVHPRFQVMDMHLAFCFPLENPPHEDVFHRWSKDLKRYNILNEFYPIEPLALSASGMRVTTIHARLDVPLCSNYVLHGFAAYAVLRAQLSEIQSIEIQSIEIQSIETQSIEIQSIEIQSIETQLPVLAISFPNEFPNSDGASFIDLEIPVGVPPTVVVASHEMRNVFSKDRRVDFYNSYLDIFPESIKSVQDDTSCSVTAVSTKNRLLAVNSIMFKGKEVKVVSPQFLLLYFLAESFRCDGDEKATYLCYYEATLAVIAEAERIYIKNNDSESFSETVFAPTVNVFGTNNFSMSYLVMLSTIQNKLHLSGNSNQALGIPDIANILVGLPSDYYPARATEHPPFSYTSNRFFHRSGEKYLQPNPGPS